WENKYLTPCRFRKFGHLAKKCVMDVETLLFTPSTPHLRIWTVKLYPLTLFFFFFSSSTLSSLWDAAVISPPGLPVETLCQLHPPPPHCRTLTLPHTLCSSQLGCESPNVLSHNV